MDNRIDHIVLMETKRLVQRTLASLPPTLRRICCNGMKERGSNRWGFRSSITNSADVSLCGGELASIIDEMPRSIRTMRQRFMNARHRENFRDRHIRESYNTLKTTILRLRPSCSVAIDSAKSTVVRDFSGSGKGAHVFIEQSPAWSFTVKKLGTDVCEGSRVILTAKKLAKLDEITMYSATVFDCKNWLDETGYIAAWTNSEGVTSAVFNTSKTRALAMMKTRVSRLIFKEMNL